LLLGIQFFMRNWAIHIGADRRARKRRRSMGFEHRDRKIRETHEEGDLIDRTEHDLHEVEDRLERRNSYAVWSRSTKRACACSTSSAARPSPACPARLAERRRRCSAASTPYASATSADEAQVSQMIRVWLARSDDDLWAEMALYTRVVSRARYTSPVPPAPGAP
jgi:hypothetical protein